MLDPDRTKDIAVANDQDTPLVSSLYERGDPYRNDATSETWVGYSTPRAVPRASRIDFWLRVGLPSFAGPVVLFG